MRFGAVKFRPASPPTQDDDKQSVHITPPQLGGGAETVSPTQLHLWMWDYGGSLGLTDRLVGTLVGSDRALGLQSVKGSVLPVFSLLGTRGLAYTEISEARATISGNNDTIALRLDDLLGLRAEGWNALVANDTISAAGHASVSLSGNNNVVSIVLNADVDLWARWGTLHLINDVISATNTADISITGSGNVVACQMTSTVDAMGVASQSGCTITQANTANIAIIGDNNVVTDLMSATVDVYGRNEVVTGPRVTVDIHPGATVFIDSADAVIDFLGAGARAILAAGETARTILAQGLQLDTEPWGTSGSTLLVAEPACTTAAAAVWPQQHAG
jgi:hypothetical protein